MNTVLTLVLVVQILTALAMIGLILLQHGKGADMGAAFGSGSSGSLFGATGSANFLSRTTAVLAAVFFACTLLLAYFGNLRPSGSGSVLESAVPATAPAAAASSPAGQIPGSTTVPAPQGPATTPLTNAPAGSVAPAAPAAPAPGPAQIPAR